MAPLCSLTHHSSVARIPLFSPGDYIVTCFHHPKQCMASSVTRDYFWTDLYTKKNVSYTNVSYPCSVLIAVFLVILVTRTLYNWTMNFSTLSETLLGRVRCPSPSSKEHRPPSKVFQAAVFVMEANFDVESHPVTAWKAMRYFIRSGESVEQILWMGINFRALEVPPITQTFWHLNFEGMNKRKDISVSSHYNDVSSSTVYCVQNNSGICFLVVC